MDSALHRARRRAGKMLNSAVSVINSSTLRRRSHFARSATTNSYGPTPIDGDSSVPLMYSSQSFTSNSTTSSNQSIVSMPGTVPVSNLIQVRSLEQSMENDLNALPVHEMGVPRDAARSPHPVLIGFVKIAEYMFVTDNKELLNKEGLEAQDISHVISIGEDCPAIVSVKKQNGAFVLLPIHLFHPLDVNPCQPFKELATKFDNVNMFIESARKISQKVVVYCKQKELAYFVAAQYNIDYYELEPVKAVHHLIKVTARDCSELSEQCMECLTQWRELGQRRRAVSATQRKLSISVNTVRGGL